MKFTQGDLAGKRQGDRQEPESIQVGSGPAPLQAYPAMLIPPTLLEARGSANKWPGDCRRHRPERQPSSTACPIQSLPAAASP